MTKIRDDLTLAAYAVALGFSIHGAGEKPLDPAAFDQNGIPHDSLQFVIGDVSVWDTSRGWRVARLIEGRFEKVTESQFYQYLKDALDEGARNWRDRQCPKPIPSSPRSTASSPKPK